MLNYSYGERSSLLAYNFDDNAITAHLPFQLVNVGDFYCGDDYYTERSGLDKFLILYTMQGAGEIRYREASARLAVGQLAVIDCMHYQYYAPAESTRWRFRWLHFRGASADTLAGLVNGPGLQVVNADPDGVIDAAFARVFTAMERGESGRAHLLSLDLHAILSTMAEQAAPRREAATGQAARQLRAVEDYIREHYAERLTLEQLAGFCHLSKYYFVRAFTAHAGCTPYEYVLRVRMGEAKRLLARTALPVAEVAALAGFSDVRSFTGQFQKRQGVSPARFRRELVFHAL